jgi:CO/xanthine dehydrogenase Mo-binding subunit
MVGVELDGRVAVTPSRHRVRLQGGVNPDAVVHQMEGATKMALGGALLQAVPLVGGRLEEPL